MRLTLPIIVIILAGKITLLQPLAILMVYLENFKDLGSYGRDH